jgi:hypothetical protein
MYYLKKKTEELKELLSGRALAHHDKSLALILSTTKKQKYLN